MNYKLNWIKGALENFETEINANAKLSNLFMYKFLVEKGFPNIQDALTKEESSEIENKIFILSQKTKDSITKEGLESSKNDYDDAINEYERLLSDLSKDQSIANMREVCYIRDFIEALVLGFKDAKTEVEIKKLDQLDSKRVQLAVSPGDLPPWAKDLTWWNGRQF